MKVRSMVGYLLSLPKTIYFNLRVFDFHTALKFPCIVNYNVEFGCLHKGCIVLDSENIKPAMILLGCSGGSPGVFTGESPRVKCGGFIGVKPESKIVFHGRARLEKGFSLKADGGATIELGNNFSANSYFFASANDLIKIGDDAVIGWNVSIRDVDGHCIYQKDDPNQKQINLNRAVHIGSHVWVAAKVDILKGTTIPDNSIVAYGTLLTGNKFTERNCIIGCNPARIIKENINWKK